MKEREVIHNESTEPLTATGYELQRGWSEPLARAIVEHSREPHIIQATPRDAKERFADGETAQQWHDQHSRVIYGLFRAVELSGLIWYNRAALPDTDAQVTFAIRMYAASRGKKLAAPFLRATEKDYRSVTQYDGPIWLSTAIDNIAAQTLYTRTGYHETARDGERLIMIKDAQS